MTKLVIAVMESDSQMYFQLLSRCRPVARMMRQGSGRRLHGYDQEDYDGIEGSELGEGGRARAR